MSLLPLRETISTSAGDRLQTANGAATRRSREARALPQVSKERKEGN